ncbi:FAD-binding protein [Amphibacillus sp. Q70]|uniref:FAD-binding protein n=1 Tax=Amphibacillus sp. Q70 TaxID=3453416 RepID=UPI003F853C84
MNHLLGGVLLIDRKLTTDVVVVGSGLSGIKASQDLADKGNQVLLISKTNLASGSSFYPLKASLGTQVTRDEQDKAVFLEDIEEMSRGMHQADLAETYVNEIPQRVFDYRDIGIEAKKLTGKRKACFARHPRDIYLISDWGKIRKNINEILTRYQNLTLMEKTTCFSLIKRDHRIVGVLLLDPNNEFVLVECKSVILATGGFGNIYKHNLNPSDVDGSGHILALEAGAKLVNMEFIQFIPGITSPRYKTLFGEQTLTYCQDVVGQKGKSLLDEYLPKGLTRQECLSIRSGHGPFTHTLESKYFDIAIMKNIIKSRNENGFTLLFDKHLYDHKEEFYTVYLDWLKSMNIDFRTNEIKIAPFAHASNGGVHIDVHGKTGIDGLYALGELTSNIEGANRLGGNSTGACLVFGYRVANHCNDYLQTIERYEMSQHEVMDHLQTFIGKNTTSNHANTDIARQVLEQIREIMWYEGNVVRTEEGLLQALTKVKELERSFPFAQLMMNKQNRKLVIKTNNFLKLSEILLNTMLKRKESRGAHFREDFPTENSNYNKRLFISKVNQGVMMYEFI